MSDCWNYYYYFYILLNLQAVSCTSVTNVSLSKITSKQEMLSKRMLECVFMLFQQVCVVFLNLI